MKVISLNIHKKNIIIRYLILILMLSILAYFLAFSKNNFEIMKNILQVFLNVIMPSLFPFILFSNILIYSNYFELLKETKFIRIIQNFFKVNKEAASCILFGFLFGYPNGARFVNEMYEKGKISHKNAEYLLMFINNASPAFILSSVGIGMFNNIHVGFFLLLVHIISSIIISKIFGYTYKGITQKENLTKTMSPPSLTFECIMQAIAKTFKTMGIILGFMTIFTILNNFILSSTFNRIFKNSLSKSILLSILELTGGLNIFSQELIKYKLLISGASAFLGFSSLSIIFQVFSVVYTNNFSFKNILKGKLLHGIISFFITYILVNIPHIYVHLDKVQNVNLALFKEEKIANTSLVYSSIVILLILFTYFSFFTTLKKKRLKN